MANICYNFLMGLLQSSTTDKYSLKFSQFLRKSMWALLILIVGYFVQYFINAVLARHLSPARYGDFSVVLSVSLLLATLAHFGSAESLLKFVPAYITKHEWGKLSGFIKRHFSLLIIIALAITIINAVVIVALIILHNVGVLNIYQYHPILLTFWIIPLLGFLIFQARLLSSIQKPMLGLISHKVLPYVLLTVGAFFLVVYSGDIYIYPALLVFGFALLGVVVFQFIAIRFYLPSKIDAVKPKFEKKQWYFLAAKFLLIGFLFDALDKLDLIMLEILGRKESIVGIYAAVVTICVMLRLFVNGFNFIIAPILSSAISNNDKQTLKNFAKKCNMLIFIIVLVVLFLVIIFGKFLLRLFGPEYVIGYYPLLIVVLSRAFNFISIIPYNLLRFSKKEVALINVNAIGLVIMITIDVLTIPKFGIYGAAFGALISRACISSWEILAARKVIY
ncbi:MAG: oligosaccharide flippase family protein [Gammaproteobacteria bacterium]|jgi:O-antigen/teichoic acid export membrane protein